MSNLPATISEALGDKRLASKFTHGRFDKDIKWAAERQFAAQALQRNPKLMECTPDSIKTALLDVAYSGLSLSPSLAHAYLIPYRDHCQFQPGYRGLLHLAYKAGTIKSVQVNLVYQGDLEFQVWTDEHGRHIKHLENHRGQRGEVTHAYTITHLTAGGAPLIEVMSREQLDRVRAAAQSRPGGGAVWKVWPEEMMKKAVIRRASKYWPKDSAGLMEHMMATADRHGFIDFDGVQEDSEPPEQELCLNLDQLTALTDILLENGIEPDVAPEWLRRYAMALGYSSIENVPARLYEQCRQDLDDRSKAAVSGTH